jgi:1-acyl-sn-glycerol-3-phosphate acyltransferase
MRFLRVVRRIVLFGGFTVVCWLALLASASVVTAARGNAAAWRAGFLTWWARRVAPLLGMEIEAHGRVPEPPFFLVSNHLSYMDVVVLAAQAPLCFVAKSEIAGWPFFGWLARTAGTLFIERANKRDIPRVVDAIDTALARGVSVAVFPEATSSAGARVLPFRAALLESAARGGIPVAYAALTYRTPPGEPPAYASVCWWGDAKFLGHVAGLFTLRRFSASVRFGSDRIASHDRKDLAARLHAAVAARFEPVRGSDAAERAGGAV